MTNLGIAMSQPQPSSLHKEVRPKTTPGNVGEGEKAACSALYRKSLLFCSISVLKGTTVVFCSHAVVPRFRG